MKSQLELLKEDLPRMEAKYGPDNPFVKGLKEQIIGLENQQFRANERERFSLSVGSSLNPVPQQELEASSLYERLISQLPPAVAKDSTHQNLPSSPKKTTKNSAK